MSKEYIQALERIKNKFIDFFHEDVPDFDIIEEALQRLEAIEKGKNTDIIDNYMSFKNDNAEPSEALEILDDFKNGLINKEIGMVMFQQYWFFNQIEKVKQALLKAQEPKQYLKWEDLKKSNSEEHLKVKLNNVKYELHFEKWARYDDATRISLYLNEFCVMSIRLKTNYEKQFFNDLRLEVVEE